MRHRMSAPAPRRLGSYITPNTLFDMGMPRDLEQLPQVCAAWAQAAGETLSQHVVPMRYSDGCLRLQADSSVWMSKVRYQQSALIARLRAHPLLSELRSLKLRVAPVQQARPAAPRMASARRPSPDMVAMLRQVAEDIADPGLREALRRLGRDLRP
jgi:hypothetical protein